MRRTMILLLAALMLGCAETKRQTGRPSGLRERMDSTTEARHRLRHSYESDYAYGHFYKRHDPDCELCRQMRRRETEAIVDSMLREYGIDKQTTN